MNKDLPLYKFMNPKLQEKKKMDFDLGHFGRFERLRRLF
jgi:hypothetical protein